MRPALLLTAVLLLPGLAAAQERTPLDPTAHRHLGFLLRADLGPSYLQSSTSGGGTSVRLSGLGLSVGMLLGGTLSENTILGADIWGMSAFSQKVSVAAFTGSNGDSSVQLIGYGVNLTHYFMPANVYLSVSPSLVVLSTSNDKGDTTGSTNFGFGGRVSIGKEWWTSDHWGIGLAAQFAFGFNKDKGDGAPTWTTVAGSLAFSATWN
jgi:hypothetical protein